MYSFSAMIEERYESFADEAQNWRFSKVQRKFGRLHTFVSIGRPEDGVAQERANGPTHSGRILLSSLPSSRTYSVFLEMLGICTGRGGKGREGKDAAEGSFGSLPQRMAVHQSFGRPKDAGNFFISPSAPRGAANGRHLPDSLPKVSWCEHVRSCVQPEARQSTPSRGSLSCLDGWMVVWAGLSECGVFWVG